MMRNAPWYIGADQATPMNAPDLAEMYAPKGMFGAGTPTPRRGRDWGRTIADFLTNFSASQGDPAAMAAIQQRGQQQQSRDEMKQRAMAREQDNGDRWSMWQRQQEWERAHPNPQQPNEFERAMAAAGILPGSPEYATMSRQRADNLANPMVGVDTYDPTTGNTVRQFMRPGQQGGQRPPPAPGEVRGNHRFRGGNPADPNSWEAIGGAGQQGPQTFPRQDGGAFDFRVNP